MKDHSNKRAMKMHVFIIFILFIFASIGLIIRVITITVKDNKKYETSVLSQHVNKATSADVIAAKRGSIIDRNGTILAESVKIYNVIYDPKVLNQYKQEVIDGTNLFLSQELPDTSIADLESLLQEKAQSSYEILARELDYNEVKNIESAISKKEIQGVFLEGDYKRIYPYHTMLSDILGFYNKNSGGSYGIEEAYNHVLKGTDGRLFGAIEELNIVNQEEIRPQNGYHANITIDFGIQKFVEDSILEFYENRNAKSVNVIIMNPKKGEILAAASYPNFNLNNPYNLEEIVEADRLNNMTVDEKYEERYALWKNALVTDAYEPGSTFKPFVLAAALEENLMGLNRNFYCDGSRKVFGYTINCWKAGGHGEQTAAQALANSCNIAFMEMGETLGKDVFWDYYQRFGFSEKTNIDTIGEAKGIFHSYEQFGPVELLTGSFGQGFNITPIQLITSFSALVNGGYMYEPYLLKSITDEDGKNISVTEPRLLRQVISEKTSKDIVQALEMVVGEGTGTKASIEGYEIGGKTATAEKGKRGDNKYIVSFMGFVPVEDPQLITLVIIDEPDTNYADSGWAVDIFTSIMKKTLPYKTIFSELEID